MALIYLVFTKRIPSFAMELVSDARCAELREKARLKGEKRWENTQWHFKSLGRFTHLNKSNGAYLRLEERERERELSERKGSREERSKEKMVGGQQEDAEKRGTMPILPLAVAFGIVASARAFLSFSRGAIGRGAAKRGRIRIYRDLPRGSLVNVLLSVRGTRKTATHVGIDLRRSHT